MTSFGPKKHRPTRTGEENKIQTTDFLNREEERERCKENNLHVEEGETMTVKYFYIKRKENIEGKIYFIFHVKSLLSQFWLD